MAAQTVGVAPDGGWGWCVVFCVFISNVLIDGTIGTFGIFYPYVMGDFNSSPALTSMTGSLIPGVYMMSAPLVGGLIHRFGCRRVSITGGVVGACGLIVASMSRSIAEFAVTYGVLGGLGIGMNSLCGHLIINTYFNKRRGMANGIVQSGAGMGVFILAPLLQYLLRSYSWRGTMLIYSGCILQYCVCGMLMRPLTISTSKESSETDIVSDNYKNSGMEQGTSEILQQQPLLKPRAFMLLQEEIRVKPKYFHSQEMTQNQNIHQNNVFGTVQGNSLPDLSVNHNRNSKDTHIFIESRNGVSKTSHSNFHNRLNEIGHGNSFRRNVLHPLDRKDIFYSGSIYNLKEYKDAGSVDNFIQEMSVDHETVTSDDSNDKVGANYSHSTPFCKRFRSVFSRFVDVSVFKNTVYVPMLLGGMFVQMGQFIPSTFLPNYCYTIGLSSSNVTTILSTYGIMNIAGRIIAGFLANMDSVSTLWLCTFGNFMCGVACALFPFCTSVISLCSFAAVFGCFIGFFGPLQVLIMVEYLGLEKLTSAMGILQLVKGPAALFGPPLAGLVYQWTENYGMSMLVAAAMFVTSALCQSSVPLINRCTKKQG